jgi:FtsP/CotA-like multicopper oxidase with cupredoxin domain
MKHVRFALGLLAFAGILVSTGCQKTNDGPMSDQKGTLVIKLTDAPFPMDMIDAATVKIVKVEIGNACDCDQEDYPFITVFEDPDPEPFNLLDFRNGLTADLVEMQIEPGSYNLIRLYVDEAGLVVKEGDEYALKVPSGAQTGIKVFMEPALQVVGGLTSEIVLDFNLDRSFVLKGNMNTPAGIKGFNFKPVIKAINNTTQGTVEGHVINSDTAIHEAPVWIGEDTVYTDEEGYYAIPGLPAGLYTISATYAGFDTVNVEGMEIVAGNLIVQDFTLTKLEEPEEGETPTE